MRKNLLGLLVLAVFPAMTFGQLTLDINWENTVDLTGFQLNLTMTGPGGVDANALWAVTGRTLISTASNPVMNNAGYWEDDDGDPETPDVWVSEATRFAEAYVAYNPRPITLAAGIVNGSDAWFEGTPDVFIEPQSGKRLIRYTLNKATGATLPNGQYTLTLTASTKADNVGTTLTTVWDSLLVNVSSGAVPAQTGALNVLVTPEPASALLLLLAAPFIRRRTA